MSYLALARKYRPRRFEDVVGQPHVVRALSHALAADRLHPAILLTGTRGVGKTTLARIIAKGLNCERGVTAEPCGSCGSCREIDEGRSVDMLEIDAASNTGVDNIRELIENSQYAPARGRYKVYLIDEVHMLSKGAFNALLKTLEEPPAHVKFILATTDPQKLPVTVLSRCLQFNLKRLPPALIRERLAQVLEAEGVSSEPAALAALARAADGSMRDGLSLLDQAIAFCGGQVLRAAVEDMLGTVGQQALLDILRALADGHAGGVLSAIEALDAQGPDYAALLTDLAGQLQRLALLQMLPQAAQEDDDPVLLELKDRISPEDVQLYYQISVAGRRDLPWAPEPRLGFQMTLLRMLAFRPDGAAPQGQGGPTRTVEAAAPHTRSAAAAAEPGAAGWPQRVEALGLEGFVKQLARHCAWTGEDERVLRLALDPQMKHLLQEDRRRALESALAACEGQHRRVVIELAPAAELPTPAQVAQQAQVSRQQAAEQAISTDPVVQFMKEQFGATLRPGSIQPIDK